MMAKQGKITMKPKGFKGLSAMAGKKAKPFGGKETAAEEAAEAKKGKK